MYDALVTLYQSEKMSKRMFFKNKLTSTHMTKSNTVSSYLMKITQLIFQLPTVGDKITENELVHICPNHFGPSRQHFVQCICVREKVLSFEGLWDGFCWKEKTLEAVSGSYEDVQDLALIGKVRIRGKKAGARKGRKKKEDSRSSN
jgi:hypothetical protein